ncbi:hypothetical protein NMY22_g19710 [Coprinellus aureogranulatus]|nr:hypothetical protein NMY22_g19710 [Coprinellus aureogranulatus]
MRSFGSSIGDLDVKRRLGQRPVMEKDKERMNAEPAQPGEHAHVMLCRVCDGVVWLSRVELGIIVATASGVVVFTSTVISPALVEHGLKYTHSPCATDDPHDGLSQGERKRQRWTLIKTRNPRQALAAGGVPEKTTASGTTGLHRTTFSSRAKTLETAATSSKTVGGDDKQLSVKRKREAFGEVAGGNKNTRLTTKGKEKENTEKEYDGVVLKAKPIARKDVKEAGGATARVKVEKEKTTVAARPARVRDEHAMAIDRPAPAPAADRMPSLTVRRSLITKDQENKVILPKRSVGATRIQQSRREIERDEEEEERVFKKRRTSSDAPEPEPHAEEEAEEEDPEAALAARLEAEMEAFANEEEADPEHGGWGRPRR